MNIDRWIICGASLILLALLTGGFGIFLLFILPPLMRNEIARQTRLGFDDSGTYTDTTRKWIAPEYNLSLNFWTFSVLNAEQVIKIHGSKPMIVEKGPYSFRELQHKEDVIFTLNNSRVFYKNSHYYFFDPEASCQNCSLDDVVTVPNIVLQNILDAVKDNFIARSAFDIVFKSTGEKVFVTTTVRELLFEGYADPLITKWCGSALMKPICDALKIPDRIGLFYKKNGTTDGKYEIDTGLFGSDRIGKIYSFNDRKTVDAWYSPYARMINGTDGQMFPPAMDRHDSNIQQLFIGPLCRTIEMEYAGTDSYEDVNVYLYKPARSMNNVDRQRELGFCNPNSPIYFDNTYIQQKGCLPAGLMDLSSCLPGHPKIYLSQPHFYGSSPALGDALAGMRAPSAQADGTVLAIEPATGAVVFAQQRSQLNLGVINGGLFSLQNLSSRIIPLVWFNETASFDSDTKTQLLAVSKLRTHTFYGGIALMVLLFSSLLGFISMIVVRRIRAGQSDGFNRRILVETDEDAADEGPEYSAPLPTE